MKYSALLLILLISFTSSKSLGETLKCVINNEKVISGLKKVLKSINAGDKPLFIFSNVYILYTEVKKAYNTCSADEPVLKGGCRFEEQFKNCQLYSCEYLEEYECLEYCARKYC